MVFLTESSFNVYLHAGFHGMCHAWGKVSIFCSYNSLSYPHFYIFRLGWEIYMWDITSIKDGVIFSFNKLI